MKPTHQQYLAHHLWRFFLDPSTRDPYVRRCAAEVIQNLIDGRPWYA